MTIWTLDHIRQHFREGLPPVPLFNIAVMKAPACRASIRA